MKTTHQNPRSIVWIFLLAFTTLTALSSCTSHTIKESWINKEYQNTTINDILIVGISNDPQERNLFEEAFVAELKEAGLIAKASYAVQQEPVEPSREAVLAVVNKTNAKYLLLTQLINYKQEIVDQLAVDRIPSDYDDQTISGFYESYEPVTSVIRSKSLLETNLYDVKSEQLIWKSVSEAKDFVKTTKYMRDVTGILIKQLKTDGLL